MSARVVGVLALLHASCAAAPPTRPSSSAGASADPSRGEVALDMGPTPTTAFAWGADGKLRVASGDALETLDLEHGVVGLERLPFAPQGLWYAHDGARALVALEDVYLWVETNGWATIQRVPRDRGDVLETLRLSPSDAAFVVAGRDLPSRVRRVPLDGRDAITLVGTEPLAWSPDGVHVAFVSPTAAGALEVVVADEGGSQRSIAAVTSPSAVAFAENGTRLAVVSRAAEAVVMYAIASDVTRLEAHDLALPAPAPPTSVRDTPAPPSTNHTGADAVLLPNGLLRKPVTGRGIERWAFDARDHWTWSDGFVAVEDLRLSPDGDMVAARCTLAAPFRVAPDGQPKTRICAWDVATGRPWRAASRAFETTAGLHGIGRDADGGIWVTKPQDGSIRVWSMGRRVALSSALGVHRDQPWPMFDRSRVVDLDDTTAEISSSRVVVRPRRGPLRVFDVARGTWSERPLPMSGAVIRGDVAYWMERGEILRRVWDTGEDLPPIPTVEDASGFDVSARGDRLVTWSRGGAIDVATLGAPPTHASIPVDPHPFELYRVLFSPDDAVLLARTTAESTRVVNVATGADVEARCAIADPFPSSEPGTFFDVASAGQSTCEDAACALANLVRWDAATGVCSPMEGGADAHAMALARRGEGRLVSAPRDDAWMRSASPRWAATVSADGTLELRDANGATWHLSALRDLDAGYVVDDAGYFDLVGGEPELAWPYIHCRVRGEPASGEACAALRAPAPR